MTEKLRSILNDLYGMDTGLQVYEQLIKLVGVSAVAQTRRFNFSEKDAILICYGDQVRKDGEVPLKTLHQLLKSRVFPLINTVHLLPFYPYSSDDGFSVIDYYAVNPELGTWEQIEAIHRDFRLMFDAVLNHISAQSEWFRAFLRGEAPYNAFFITADPTADLSQVRRPRTLPLLTAFQTAAGEQHVWTTFSSDQIDLNFANPEVLLEMVRVILHYVSKGADLIRLDAIAYLWKIVGTTCIHLEQTHHVVQLIREVLDIAAPEVSLITETNVPHEENMSYFGDGKNEAQMVYQFSLPPLVLHSFRTGDAKALTRWAATLTPPSDSTTFFNFTASHDGIGVTPLRGLLPEHEIDALCEMVLRHGGFVSYKNNADGSRSPYELNITYFDAITHPDITAQEPDTGCRRFICSQAMMLAMQGIPGIYFHSLFGSRSDLKGVQMTGRYRSINREKSSVEQLETELDTAGSLCHRVYDAYCNLLQIRVSQAAFHPLAAQQVLNIHPAVFAIERTSRDGHHRILALHNVSSSTVEAAITTSQDSPSSWRDLLTSQVYIPQDGKLEVRLEPFQILWVKQQLPAD